MNSVNSKVSYLKGLVKGLEIDKNSKEGRIIVEIINVLDDVSEEISDMAHNQRYMSEHINEIDGELSDLLDAVMYDDTGSFEDAYDNFEELKCPNCNDMVYIDRGIMEQGKEIACPNCHQKIPVVIKKDKQ